MGKRKVLQTNFSAGELDPTLGMRADTDQYSNGAKSLLNRRVLVGGGTKRRPGTWWRGTTPLAGRAEPWIISEDLQFVVVFSPGRMATFKRDPATGDLTATGVMLNGWLIEDAIWTMDIAQYGNAMVVTERRIPPHIIRRVNDYAWTMDPFTWAPGPGTRINQPYAKIAGPECTLAPSGPTGIVNVFASDPIFTPQHVGVRLRYRGREIVVTAYSTPFLVVGQVLETLPPTDLLTVGSTTGFTVGQIVQHETTGTEGEITSIASGTQMLVAVMSGLDSFTGGTLIGPDTTTTISAVAAGAVAAVRDWDEQVSGPVYGYPGCVEVHRGRMIFGGFNAVPNGLAGSRIDNIYNFDVGDGSDADGFFVTIGDAATSMIVQLYSAENLIVLTDTYPYYMPESSANPFRPSSLAFYQFGSKWPATLGAKAQGYDEGVVYVSGSLIIKLTPTGDTSRAWQADEVSLLSSHLIKKPQRLTVVSNYAGGPERYVILVNDDGTIAALMIVEAQKIRNAVPWVTTGTYDSVVGIAGDLYAMTTRTLNGAVRYCLEQFDQDITLDAATQFADLNDVPATYGATVVNIVTGNYHLGTYPPTAPDPPAGPYVVGLNYESVIETMPAVVTTSAGTFAGDRMRVTEAYIFTLSSARFAVQASGDNVYETHAYLVTEPLDEPPPLRSGPQRVQFLGWKREPTIRITQPDPLPLDVLAIRSEVVW